MVNMCCNISVRGALIHHHLLTHRGLGALEYVCLLLKGVLSECHLSRCRLRSAALVRGRVSSERGCPWAFPEAFSLISLTSVRRLTVVCRGTATPGPITRVTEHGACSPATAASTESSELLPFSILEPWSMPYCWACRHQVKTVNCWTYAARSSHSSGGVMVCMSRVLEVVESL